MPSHNISFRLDRGKGLFKSGIYWKLKRTPVFLSCSHSVGYLSVRVLLRLLFLFILLGNFRDFFQLLLYCRYINTYTERTRAHSYKTHTHTLETAATSSVTSLVSIITKSICWKCDRFPIWLNCDFLSIRVSGQLMERLFGARARAYACHRCQRLIGANAWFRGAVRCRATTTCPIRSHQCNYRTLSTVCSMFGPFSLFGLNRSCTQNGSLYHLNRSLFVFLMKIFKLENNGQHSIGKKSLASSTRRKTEQRSALLIRMRRPELKCDDQN